MLRFYLKNQAIYPEIRKMPTKPSYNLGHHKFPSCIDTLDKFYSNRKLKFESEARQLPELNF